mgnify:CR=1 FL=1
METLNRFLAFPLEQIPFVLLVLLIAFTIHEFSHAYTAYKFGDPTPKHHGRVTLNPRVHLDVLGTILIFLAGFGWAKPVLINRANFKRPRMMGILVAIAGPLSNLLLCFLSLFVLHLLLRSGALEGLQPGVQQAITLFLHIMVSLNMVLFVFNMIPLPPLDGYHVLENVLPREWALKLQQIQPWAIFIFLLIVFIPPLHRITLGPLFALGNQLLLFMYTMMSKIL